ncbi:hypothetical protein MMC31_006477 [Peltigera leucophlebia]|nr:hypothetical protein [Peltigera leucophlebia]
MRTTVALSRNFAFTDALQQHLAKLSPDEKSAFRTSHQTLTAESILVKVRDYDRDRNHDSNSRRCAEQVEKSLRILSQFLKSIAIAIQSNPEISSLIVGGVRFILDTLSDVYGDLLDFCRQTRRIFADNKGRPRKYISIVTFLRVQWEPFETRFGKVSSSFRHHLAVLSHSVQALQYNAILDGNRAAAVERQRAQQKDAEETRKNFMNWICTTDFEKEHALTFEKRYKDTGNWLLEEPVFEQWFGVTDSRVLWCYGKRNLST